MERLRDRQGRLFPPGAGVTLMIKAIFFDASETLIHLPKGVAWHYAEVARGRGLEIDERELGLAFRAVWKQMAARPATGQPRPDDDRGWWRELVARVLARCGAEAGTDFEALFAALYERFCQPGVWELYSDVRPVLERLRGGFALGVISNFDGRLRRILYDLDVLPLFETIVISSEAGADKPHPLIFEEALRRLGVQPAEAIHVGDDPVHDWAGAASAGIRCFELKRGENSLADLPHWLAAL